MAVHNDGSRPATHGLAPRRKGQRVRAVRQKSKKCAQAPGSLHSDLGPGTGTRELGKSNDAGIRIARTPLQCGIVDPPPSDAAEWLVLPILTSPPLATDVKLYYP